MLKSRRRLATFTVGSDDRTRCARHGARHRRLSAGTPPGKSKCNAGNGNGSESLADTGSCYMGDPGNSYNAGNRGGDEIPFSHGTPNRGDNNGD